MTEISEIVAAARVPLASLVDERVRVWVPSVVDEWELPESDRAALKQFGLPAGPLLEPDFQPAVEPELSPNVAGDLEARLIKPEQRLYRLGQYGAKLDFADGRDFTIKVGAVAGTGQVLGIRALSMTTADIAVQLRDVYPDLYHPAVCYFNASVAAFVEVAWRWYAAVEMLRALPEPHYSAPFEEHERHHDQVERSRQRFLATIVEMDPTMADEQLDSIWVETITDDD